MIHYPWCSFEPSAPRASLCTVCRESIAPGTPRLGWQKQFEGHPSKAYVHPECVKGRLFDELRFLLLEVLQVLKWKADLPTDLWQGLRALTASDQAGEPAEEGPWPDKCPACGGEALVREGCMSIACTEHLKGDEIVSDVLGETDRRIGVWEYACETCHNTWQFDTREQLTVAPSAKTYQWLALTDNGSTLSAAFGDEDQALADLWQQGLDPAFDNVQMLELEGNQVTNAYLPSVDDEEAEGD